MTSSESYLSHDGKRNNSTAPGQAHTHASTYTHIVSLANVEGARCCCRALPRGKCREILCTGGRQHGKRGRNTRAPARHHPIYALVKVRHPFRKPSSKGGVPAEDTTTAEGACPASLSEGGRE